MYKDDTQYSDGSGLHQKAANIVEINGESAVHLDSTLVRQAEMHKDGDNLVLETPDGQTVIQNYYAQETAPDLTGSDGTVLTPKLVQSFLKSDPHYANIKSLSDESPVGEVQELTGEVTITRVDGSIHKAEIGAPIYQNDVIETGTDASVNLSFMDETQFAISKDSRLSIDEYVFDPSTNEGVNNFSVLKGVFVFTSGLIGREDPDDINIDTPMGSIGIRGTIIAGNADSGEITVVEGAIVLRDLHGNELTLADQFETAIFEPVQRHIRPLGQLSADDVINNFESVSDVAGDLFSSIQDAANDDTDGSTDDAEDTPTEEEASETEGEEETDAQQADASETLDGEALDNNIMEINAAKSLADDLNEALKGLGDDFEEREIDELSSDYDSLPPPLFSFESLLGENNAPISFQSQNGGQTRAPAEFFSTIEGRSWVYDFSQEFSDLDGDALSYEIFDEVDSQLATFQNNGFLTYSLSEDTGVLTINPILPLSLPITISIEVEDSSNASVREDFSFNLINSAVNANTYEESGAILTNSGDTVFLRDNDTNPFVVEGDNNVIRFSESQPIGATGNEGRTVEVGMNAEGNLIIGGSRDDVSIVKNSNNIIRTIDGDDLVILDLDQSINVSELNIDMGLNTFSYTQAYAEGLRGASLQNSGASFGDILELIGNNGAIDLTNAPLLQNIETISIGGVGANRTLALDLETVFNINDDHTLIINSDGSSILNSTDTWAIVDRDGNGQDTQTLDVVGGGAETYNVWEGQFNGETVTLLVDTDITANIA